ncbi:MAG: amylo-alpha-1,6-glucosidase [Bacteroidetes bacterium HGW-Bacteroidetes-6]|jgi:predicted glycogen debranching enzyme|nr:MAG: amylo-alpha-1,6-glucosidase [Bacteroidetes bacterium HGW-Bacteroidetes-6]
MGYIQFDKKQLVNLEYALSKELLRSNRAGAYSSTTIIGCNTRKYHGLLVSPQPAIDDELHVLLSCLDETIIQHDAEFNLALHRFPETWSPRGHKYIVDFDSEPIPALYYRVGGVHLKKELLLASDDRMLIRYTLLDAHSPTRLRLRPFMAYRSRHKLSKANGFVERKFSNIKGGVKTRMYQGYSYLHFQFSRDAEYVHVPDWYNNFEYIKDLERGYEGHEDLFTPGYFEIDIIKGTSLILSVGTSETEPRNLGRLFARELAKRTPRDNFENCLSNSADQFIVVREGKTEIVAGYPWFGRWGRDTLISLPGLTLARGQKKIFKSAVDTLLLDMNGPLLPNVGHGDAAAFNSIDAPLWLFWALQQYALSGAESHSAIWNEYGPVLKIILNGLRNGKVNGIYMQENGLLYASIPGKALTWMDAIVDGKPVTPRAGLPVEINALWYNAIMFSLEMAGNANDELFVTTWQPVGNSISTSFKETFWDKEKGYLADYCDGDFKDWSVRPNMVFATSLPYSPLSEKIRQLILEKVRQELLTSRGLRTLSPKNSAYKGSYEGVIRNRDLAYHQGTVWPWLLGHYAEGYLKIYGKEGVSHIKGIYNGMEEVIFEHGVGSVSEVYSGDPPHKAGGAISQAWSVAEIIRIKSMLDQLQ